MLNGDRLYTTFAPLWHSPIASKSVEILGKWQNPAARNDDANRNFKCLEIH